MAVATIVAYDVYKPYTNRNADGRTMVTLQRIMVVIYSILSGMVTVGLFKLNVSLSWVYMFMGIVIGSAVFPIAASLTWAKCSATAACVSAVVTTPLAIMTWLITAAKLNDGKIDLETTGQDYPMLAGNLVALFFSMIICIILSYIFPQVGFRVRSGEPLVCERMRMDDSVFYWDCGISHLLIHASSAFASPRGRGLVAERLRMVPFIMLANLSPPFQKPVWSLLFAGSLVSATTSLQLMCHVFSEWTVSNIQGFTIRGLPRSCAQDFDWAELRNIPVIESDPNSDPNTFDGEDSPEALNRVRL